MEELKTFFDTCLMGLTVISLLIIDASIIGMAALHLKEKFFTKEQKK